MSLGGFEPPTFRSEAERSIQAELQAHNSRGKPCLVYKLLFSKWVFSVSHPFEFFVWIQLKQAGPYDTRLKITLKANLNMMMKMMIGSKLQAGVDGLADQIAMAFNGQP